jgi:TRAP-type C4-dicarboxylate transport system permease small subunit
MKNDRVTSAYDKIKRANTICAKLSGLILLFMILSMFVDVFLRYVFNHPSVWVTEVSTYLLLYVVFLGTAYTLQQDTHIRVTFIRDFFDARAKRIIDLLTSIFGMLFTLALLWQTSVMTWTAFKEDWVSPTTLVAPYAYIYCAMVFGALLLFVTYLLRTILQIRGTKLETSD